jgi:RHS repeat-associated protein
MSTYKTNSSGSTSYRYDGQIGMEDIDYAAGDAKSAGYPIFDSHGNMISTLKRQGAGIYATSALRTFDAWGNIRIGAQTGDPKGRYCANLGHKQDDESGLVHMRAGYYEPSFGRFISSDSHMQGHNWFGFCANDPVNKVDNDGHSWANVKGWIALLADVITAIVCVLVGAPLVVFIILIVVAICCVVDIILTAESIIKAGKKPLENGDHGGKAWKKELQDQEAAATVAIDDLKSSGNPSEALLGENLELVYWTAAVADV